MGSATRKAHTTRTARKAHRPAGRRNRPVAVGPAGTDRPQQGERDAGARLGADGTRLRLTARGRLVVVLGLLVTLLAAFSFGRAADTEAAVSPEPRPALTETTVQPGESLWAVAQRIAPESDPREVVQQVRRINGLPDSRLQAGQQLLLPG